MRGLICLMLVLSLSACLSSPKIDKIVLKETSFNKLPGWRHDAHDVALATFIKSCESFEKQPEGRAFAIAEHRFHVKDLKAICLEARRIEASNQPRARQFFETWFAPYVVTNNGNSEGIFTGYFEIGVKGSTKPSKKYHYPLYKVPASDKDRNKCRKDIDGGCLHGKGLELVYLEDPVRAFFLHIQGSGRVALDNGKVMRVGFDGKNNYGYTSIGKYLVEKGVVELDGLSAQKLQAWLKKNPKEAEDVMHQNESYVFFKELSTKNPKGAQDVELTPERSLAVDKRFIPYGLPLWMNIHYPKTANYPETPVRRLMIAQDTGGAIRGPVRGDVFFGYGSRAEEISGHMRQKGGYTVLLPMKKR